jgi:hypothetical protein
MDLTKEIAAAGKKYQSDITNAERAAKAQKIAVDEAEKEYERRQTELYDAQMAQYNARIAVVQKHIDKEIMTMKPKFPYDPKRVEELRAILAKTKDKEYQSYEKRFEILKALRELQLIVTVYPFVQRISDLVTKWTGKSLYHATDDRTKFYPFCWELVDGKRDVLKLYDRLDEKDHWWLQHRPDVKYKSIVFLNLDINRSGLRGLGTINDFWEINCARMKIRPEFLIQGEPSKPLKYGEQPERSGTFWENCAKGIDVQNYINDVNRLGWEAISVNDRYYADTLPDEVIASVIISGSPSIFTVKEVAASMKYLVDDPDSPYPYMHNKMHVWLCVQSVINRLLTAKHNGIKDVRFDLLKRRITWTKLTNRKNKTPKKEKQSLDVSRVKLAKVAEYAFKHIKGLESRLNKE